MTKVTINNHDYYVPSGWDQFTKKQLLTLSHLTEVCHSTMEIQLKLFLACVGGTVDSQIGDGVYVLKMGRQKHVLFSDEIGSIAGVFNFLFEINDDGNYALSPKLTINHFKELRSGFTLLHGAGDALQDTTYNQFVWLQTYHNLLDEREPRYLDELINIIYKTKSGQHESKHIRRICRHTKKVILWYYIGSLHFLSAQFPRVLGGGSGDGEQINVFDNQQRIIDSLAEGDVTKKDQVRESLLYDALYSMDMAAKRMEEMEKQAKN